MAWSKLTHYGSLNERMDKRLRIVRGSSSTIGRHGLPWKLSSLFAFVFSFISSNQRSYPLPERLSHSFACYVLFDHRQCIYDSQLDRMDV